jgi:hypothetical protein
VIVVARLDGRSGTATRLKKRGSVMFFKGCTSLLVPEQSRVRATRSWWGGEAGIKITPGWVLGWRGC